MMKKLLYISCFALLFACGGKQQSEKPIAQAEDNTKQVVEKEKSPKLNDKSKEEKKSPSPARSADRFEIDEGMLGLVNGSDMPKVGSSAGTFYSFDVLSISVETEGDQVAITGSTRAGKQFYYVDEDIRLLGVQNDYLYIATNTTPDFYDLVVLEASTNDEIYKYQGQITKFYLDPNGKGAELLIFDDQVKKKCEGVQEVPARVHKLIHSPSWKLTPTEEIYCAFMQ